VVITELRNVCIDFLFHAHCSTELVLAVAVARLSLRVMQHAEQHSATMYYSAVVARSHRSHMACNY
jgi:hypothetical protein